MGCVKKSQNVDLKQNYVKHETLQLSDTCLRSDSDLIKNTKFRAPDFAHRMETLLLPWNCFSNYSSFISERLLVMGDLHPAYQITHLKEKTASQWFRGRSGSHFPCFAH